jgi:hypothetical protein
MSVEGLHYLLEKNEVVDTASALDLRDRPEQIEIGYRRHVRSFVPMSRFAQGSSLSVEDLERRLFNRTREGKAPRGYIAAGYGYGKTSTALYLWEKGEAANLLVVPPFRLDEMSNMLDALYGWARHRLSRKRPDLLNDLDALYAQVVDRSLQTIASRYGVSLEAAQSMRASGTLNLETQPHEYVGFFEGVTEVALRAGYNGVILIPDEIQQFIRPRNQDRIDTISPLFQIIQLLGTREANASLHFGFMMSITLEEIAMIRDTHKRGDLLARLRELSVDLTDIYTAQFARTLWDQLAQTFDFTAEKDAVIDAYTLDALGNISASKSLSDGPRTVVNVLKRAVAAYLERHRAYTPIDMIDDFLDERIAFKGNDRIPSITRQRLAHPFVMSNRARYDPAVRLIAAFGFEGVPVSIQRHYGYEEAIDELMQKTIGEVVRIGANLSERAIALIGLNEEADNVWHKEIIRNFRLGWNATSRETRDSTFAAFTTVLMERVFPKSKLVETRSVNMVSNYGVILEVDADGQDGRRYPKRRIHIRLLWQDEEVKDAGIHGEVCLEYRLSTYDHWEPEARRSSAESAYVSEAAHTVTIPINLSYMPEDAAARPLYQQLQDVWSPYDLSPIILLNLYQLMHDLNEAGEMPKQEASFLTSSMMPEFLDYAVSDMFNSHVGASQQAAGADISVLALAYLLTQRYPNYVTFMNTSQWMTALAKYKVALERLESALMRRGDEPLTTDKASLAELFPLSNTGLDSFMSAFSMLLTVEREPGKQPGIVRFTLHPLEQQILAWLRESDKTVTVGSFTVRRIGISQVVRWAIDLGYHRDEIGKAIDLLITREVITQREDWLVEAVNESLNLETLRNDLRAHQDDLAALAQSFPGEQLHDYQEEARKASEALAVEARAKSPDPAQLSKIANTLKKNRRHVASYAKDRLTQLSQRAKTLHVDFLRSNDLPLIEQPLNDEIDYVDQVNALRVRLLSQLNEVQQRVRDYEAQVQQVQRELRPDVTIPILAQQANALRQLESQQSELQGRVAEARERFAHFRQWRELVKNGAATRVWLHELRLDGVNMLESALHDFILEVRAELSARKLDALSAHQKFTERLETIRQEVDALRQNARTTFNARRDACVDLLRQMETRLDPALTGLSFNPADPNSAYTLLYDLTQRHLISALDDLHQYIVQRQQTASVIQRQAAHLPSREANRLQNEAGEIAGHLEDVDEKVKRLRADLEQFGAEAAVSTHGAALLETYRALRANSTTLHQELEALRRSVKQLELTPAESRLRECLNQLASDGTLVDLLALQRAYNDDDTFWASLRGLHEKDGALLRIALPTNTIGA